MSSNPFEDVDDTIADARDGPTDDDDDSSSPAGGGGPPEDDNDDPPSEGNVDAVTPSPNPGLPSTENGSSGGSGSSGSDSGSSGPPEDDNDQPDFPEPDRTPPSERPGRNIPERDEPPEDSGSESRLDQVTPSENPGRGIEDTRRAPDDGNEARLDEVARREFEEANDPTEGVVTESDRAILRDAQGRSGPASRQQEAIDRIVAQSELQREDIRGVRRRESGEQVAFEPILTEQAREEQAREQFEERRESARRQADVDRVSRLGGFEVDQLEFESTDQGATVRPTEEAARSQLREQAANQFGIAESEVMIEEADGELVASVEQEPTDRLDVEDREPSRAAELLGTAGQEFRDASPGLATAIGLSAASLRTDRGLPIPGTDLTSPGEEDVDDFVDRLEPSAQRIDQGVSTTVDIATEPGDRLAERVDVTPTDVLEATNDPALAATAATVGTSVGREGAERGVETGVQAFNPVRAVQDSAQFTEAGILAADEVTSEGAAEDIQTAADVSRAAGRLAVQLGPPAAAGAVARDPALAFEAPIAAGTIVAGGALIGSGPAAARAGARTGRRAVDAGSDAVERSAGAVRRQADRFDDLDVSIERDADAGPLEIDGLSPSERAGLAVRRARRDRPSAGEVGRAVRFEGEQIASRARERVSDAAPERPSLSPGSVTPDTEPAVRRIQGAAIDTQLAALRARSAARQAVSNPDEIATRVRGAASEATDRVTGAGSQARDRVTGEARGLEADLDLAVRRVQSNDFLSDDSTRRSFPRLGEFTPEPNTRTAARRRLRGLGIDARLAALRAGSTARDLASRPRAAAQSARQRVGESAFLSDTSTGRADVTQLLPSAPSRPSAPTFGVRSRLSGLGDRDLPSPGELTVRIDTGDSLPGQNRRVIDVEDLEGPDPAAGVPEVDEGVTAQGGVQVTDDVAQSSGGGQMTLVRRQAEQVDSATAQSQSRNLSPSTFDGSGTGLAAGSGLLGAASVGDDVDPETATSDLSPDEEEFADFAMDVDTDPGGVQQVDESPAVEGPPTVDEQGSTGEPTRLTPTSEENGVVSDPLDTGAQEGVGTTPERAPQQGAGTDTETTPGVGTGNIQRPIFSTPQQGFTQQTTRIPVNTITPTFTIRTPIRRTPTPTPPLGDRSDRAFGTEAASGGSVGVGSLGAPGPGWFAETIEAAATGFTSEPRSGLAADPGELGDVEAAGFDLATEEVAEGDQGVASVGEVFGLDLDDEQENQEQENPEEFFGFTL